MNFKIFKAYDIRGIVPEEMNADVAYQIGWATARALKVNALAVGRDMRLSSEEVFQALSDGIRDTGCSVTDIGLCSTDGLYFTVGHYPFAGGIMITASHNPKEYNGMKICRAEAVPLSANEGLDFIQGLIKDGGFTKSANRGSLENLDIREDFTAHVLSFIDIRKIRPLKVVLDAGNGMAGHILPPVLKRLPLEAIPLYFDLDGSFPNHPASPIEVENCADCGAAILREKADLGAAFDGDADRMFLMDEKGRQLDGGTTTALVARNLLEKHPGSRIVYNLICSKAVPELVTRMGGDPVRTRVGHAYIKPEMKRLNAIFGGEHSGHFYFRDNWFADSGLVALLMALEVISASNRPLSEQIREIDPYYRSGEINSRVQGDVQAILDRLSTAFPDATQDTLDGLTVSYPDWWFNVRASNTEPLLRMNLEAGSPAEMERKRDLVLGIIQG